LHDFRSASRLVPSTSTQFTAGCKGGVGDFWFSRILSLARAGIQSRNLLFSRASTPCRFPLWLWVTPMSLRKLLVLFRSAAALLISSDRCVAILVVIARVFCCAASVFFFLTAVVIIFHRRRFICVPFSVNFHERSIVKPLIKTSSGARSPMWLWNLSM